MRRAADADANARRVARERNARRAPAQSPFQNKIGSGEMSMKGSEDDEDFDARIDAEFDRARKEHSEEVLKRKRGDLGSESSDLERQKFDSGKSNSTTMT